MIELSTGEMIPRYNFVVPTWNQFLDREQELLEIIDPAVAVLYAPAGTSPTFAAVVAAKVMAGLGVKDLWKTFLELIESIGPSLWRGLMEAIAAKNWKLVKELLKQILKIIKDPVFLQMLKHKIGAKAAEDLITKIGGKILPGIGWAITIGSIVWAFAEQLLAVEAHVEGTQYIPARA
jgi:hypothetical protein